MPQYTPPLRDMQFVMHEVLDVVDELKAMPRYADIDADTINAVLEEGGKFAAEVAFPLNRSGDEQGCTLDADDARGAHARGLQGGLAAVRRRRLAVAGLRPGLRRPGPAGAAEPVLLRDAQLGQPGLDDVPGPVARRLRMPARPRHAEQKALYLPKLITGEWTRHDVPDRAAVRHRPGPAAHQGRAAAPTAATSSPAARSSSPPASTTWRRTSSTWCWRGCPTRRRAARASRCSWCRSSCPRPTARWASATPIFCGALEHKMGIHGNATCVMNLDGARGWLVGEPNKGLAAMFVMMNAARLGVGMQGLGLTEVAYQNARGLCEGPHAEALADRRQGAGQAGRPDHRASRRARMLLTCTAYAEGGRAIATGLRAADRQGARHPDDEVARAKPATSWRC